MDFTRASKMCSFCAKPGGPETKLAGGLGAMICDECVKDLHENNRSPETIEARSTPPWDAMSDPDLLAMLPLILRSADQNMAFAQEWVDLLRQRKISWAEIGKVLGVSRQSVWERFAHRGARKSASA
ncbi:ClpX C4-type zinc finger protein [Nocardioides sp. InS609-2]|uniref:ClpX C4-type zinc finger protein n=1 Tax=Nocardioides sp. InS609-2 TaxID=2760705 RepID=UPI0020C151EC|nr:ClpX C4-type zinc finger protein [Nocardioides sp. InS609-2]